LPGKQRQQISEARRQRSERTRVSQDRVVQELARMAFSRINDILDWDGERVRVRSIEEMGDAAAAIANIQVTTDRFEKGDGVFLVRTRVLLRLHDKIRPLHLLAKHLGLFEEGAAEDPDDVQAQIARTAEQVMRVVRKLGIQTYVPIPKIAPVEGGGNGAAGGLPTTQD
jgi:hypothetical protein